jgi:ABC-type lipoprotein release transport system permease subunit
VIPKQELSIGVPLNTSGGFPLFAIPEAGVGYLLDACDLRLKHGRLLKPRTNEVVLSEEIATVLGLRIGDQIGRSVDEGYYGSIPTTMLLVGILERAASSVDLKPTPGPGVRLGLASYEFLESHEIYTYGPPSLLVLPKEGQKSVVDRFLETEIASTRTVVSTHRLMQEMMARVSLFIRLVFGVVDVLVAIVVALAVGTIHRIGLDQRLVEFGLLHAVGHGRGRLVRRLVLETATLAVVGFLAGLALSWLLFAYLKVEVLAPSLDLDLGNLSPIWFAVPIPLVVIVVVGWGMRRTFRRLDSVAILDRGELGLGADVRRPAVKRSSSKPLSSWTFYRRHSRRGLVLALVMALMMVAVAAPVFLFAPMIQASGALYEHAQYLTVVWPRLGGAIDPGVLAQIRSHPAVAKLVPVLELGMLVSFPPLNQEWLTMHGVPEEDLPFLIELYGLQLDQGRLPRPRSNEIVLSKAVAMNRGVGVGDRVGKPAFEEDDGIPTEMVVTGILSPQAHNPRATGVWVGFASFEYLRSHEAYASQPVRQLAIPVEGRKAEMDAWLETAVASDQTAVQTYEDWQQTRGEMARTLILVFGAVEGLVALVAALALAVLSYVFFSQRQQEFGTLHAIGHSRRWLVGRTLGETAAIVILAWLIGAVVCMLGLVYMQVSLYMPKGLTLNLLDITPWLFTMPMPLAIVAASGGLVVWMLSKLDPVSIIERRP